MSDDIDDLKKQVSALTDYVLTSSSAILRQNEINALLAKLSMDLSRKDHDAAEANLNKLIMVMEENATAFETRLNKYSKATGIEDE